MDSDMQKDLEKYKEEYKQLKKMVSRAMASGASKERIDILSEKMFDLLFKIKVLESEIGQVNESKGGKSR